MGPLAQDLRRELEQRAHHPKAMRWLNSAQRRNRHDEGSRGHPCSCPSVRVLQNDAVLRGHANALRSKQVWIRERLRAFDLVAGDRGCEHPVPHLVKYRGADRVDEVSPRRRDERTRNPSRLKREKKFTRTRAPVNGLGQQQPLDGVDEECADLIVVVPAASVVDHVRHRVLDRSADKRTLMLWAPLGAQRCDNDALRLVPDLLGLDKKSVHIEQDCGRKPHVALKYLASGWCTISAEVDCSGWSWNSSDSSTPIREGSRSSTSTACCSTSGQAGYPKE